MKRGLVRTILVIGLALIAAPAVFRMFTRAPNGGHMINDFRPYMSRAVVQKYKGYMSEIDRAYGAHSAADCHRLAACPANRIFGHCWGAQ